MGRGRRLAVVVAGLVAAISWLCPADAGAAARPEVAIPQPCAVTHAYPDEATPTQVRDQLAHNWGFTTTGQLWTDPAYRPVVREIWLTLDAIACTPYLPTLLGRTGGTLALHATVIDGWAAGDFGLTKAGAVSLDLPQMLAAQADDPGYTARLFVHEISHAYSVDRNDSPGYYARFQQLYARHATFGSYANSPSETFSEIVGYYVARCSVKNPYTAADADYYRYVRDEVFGGREFGPAPGDSPDCSAATQATVLHPVPESAPVDPGTATTAADQPATQAAGTQPSSGPMWEMLVVRDVPAATSTIVEAPVGPRPGDGLLLPRVG